jgi:large subunit ribosomal protein L35
MPKMKTNKSAASRFRVRKSGSVKKGHQHMTHILGKMTPKRKRQLRKSNTVDKTQEKLIKTLIQG